MGPAKSPAVSPSMILWNTSNSPDLRPGTVACFAQNGRCVIHSNIDLGRFEKMEIGVKRGPPVYWYRGTVLLLFLWCGPVLASSPAFDALLVEAGWAEKISGDGTGALLGIVGEDACMEEVGRHECEATRLCGG